MEWYFYTCIICLYVYFHTIVSLPWYFEKILKWELHMKSYHCLKSVRNRDFSGPSFLSFGLNTKIYKVHLCILSKSWKSSTRKLQIQKNFTEFVMNFLICGKYFYVYENIYSGFRKNRKKLNIKYNDHCPVI